MQTLHDSSSEEYQDEKLALLQNWASGNDLIPEIPENHFRLFLQSCNCDVELTKNTFTAYYKLRIRSPEYFANRDPTSNTILTASTNGYSFPLLGETKDGYKIFMCGYLHTDTSTFVYTDTMKRFLMTIDLWISKQEFCPGLIVMIDCKNSTFSHMTAAPLDAARKMANYFQAVYFINISPAMNFFLSLLQPFLSKRITGLIHRSVRGSEEYFNVIPKEMLPLDIGGEAGTIQELNDAMTQELIDHAEWFREEDETIRLLAMKSRRSSKNEFD